MGARDLQTRRGFLRSLVEGAARTGGELVSPLRHGGAVLRNYGFEKESATGPEADRARTGGPEVGGEILAALNDLSGVYEP